MRVISGKARGTVLHSIDSFETRPTLDRIKESLFNILQNDIEEAVILDLFSGSGAIAIEFLSRGAKKAYLCDKSENAIKMIRKNLEKTKFLEKAVIYNKDYNKCLNELKNIKFDLIFLDPPYKQNYAIDAIKKISEKNLLNEGGKIIIETDEPQRDIKEFESIPVNYKMYDLRKYGRVSLMFFY